MDIPKTWADITIKQFNEYQAINESKQIDEFEKVLYMVSIFCKIPKNEVDNMPLDKFKKAVKDIDSLINSKRSEKIISEFTINGVKYKYDYMHPIKSAGQYATIMVLGRKKNIPSMSFHKLLAIFYLPEQEQSFEERCNIFLNNLTMNIAFPMTTFFLTSSPELMKAMQDYLEKKKMKEMRKLFWKLPHLKIIMKGGDGLRAYRNALKNLAKLGRKSKSGV